MPELFDAYHKLLGIPPSEQPPNHYRLLGLQLFEADQEVIAAGAVQRMNWVRKFQKGPHGAVAQKLAQEITSAWAILINVQRKARYDETLKQRDVPAAAMAATGAATASPLGTVSNAQPLFDPPETLPDVEDLRRPPDVKADPSVPEFDPYQKWLAIPPSEQPPNHYRLLGLSLFEADPLTIATAAMQRVDWIQKCRTSPACPFAKKLTDEVSQATEWLLDPQRKQNYDQLLRAHQAPRPASFVPAPSTVESGPTPFGDVDSFIFPVRRGKRRKRSPGFSLVMYVTSAAAGLLLGYLILRLMGHDILHPIEPAPHSNMVPTPGKTWPFDSHTIQASPLIQSIRPLTDHHSFPYV